MSKVLKWGILGVCTIIVSKDIHKNLWKNLFIDAQEKIFFLKNWQKSGYGNICILWHKCGTKSNFCEFFHAFSKTRARNVRRMTTEISGEGGNYFIFILFYFDLKNLLFY